MSAFPLVFMGTDSLSLKALNQLLMRKEFKVKAVVTRKARPKGRGLSFKPSLVAQKAGELKLPLWAPEDLKACDFLSAIKSLKAKWLIVLSYGKILPPELLSLFPERALNFHASLLPRWRGAAPIQRAIMAGDTQLGMSLQLMKKELDQGPLIGLKSFSFTNKMDARDVFSKMGLLIEELFPDMLAYMRGEKRPVPQQESSALYAQKIQKSESRIDWDRPALKIFNQIRALVMGPQAYTVYKAKRLKIFKAFPVEGWTQNPGPPLESAQKPLSRFSTAGASSGQVVELAKDHFKVACYKSLLKVQQVQPESKKILSAGEYIRGCGLKPGDKFS